MASSLSPAAQKILEGLLRGESLNDLAPAGSAERSEVEEHLLDSLQAKPARRTSRKAAPAFEPTGHVVAFSDGASRGNPGPASYGIHILDADGGELAAEGACIGSATNNVAEYKGVIAVLNRALQLGIEELELRLDSELIVKQLNGAYRVKQPALQDLKADVDDLMAQFESVQVRHIPRAQNAAADALANEALDAG